jgi:hypothetical protein
LISVGKLFPYLFKLSLNSSPISLNFQLLQGIVQRILR